MAVVVLVGACGKWAWGGALGMRHRLAAGRRCHTEQGLSSDRVRVGDFFLAEWGLIVDTRYMRHCFGHAVGRSGRVAGGNSLAGIGCAAMRGMSAAVALGGILILARLG